jgi:hypothetical protein
VSSRWNLIVTARVSSRWNLIVTASRSVALAGEKRERTAYEEVGWKLVGEQEGFVHWVHADSAQ